MIELNAKACPAAGDPVAGDSGARRADGAPRAEMRRRLSKSTLPAGFSRPVMEKPISETFWALRMSATLLPEVSGELNVRPWKSKESVDVE